RLQEIATPQRPVLAAVVGREGPGETLQVHAVFREPKGRATVEQIVRDANAKLSSSQQIRGWTIWQDPEFPTTPTQKVKKREIVERLLATDRGGAAPAPPGAASARERSQVERTVLPAAHVPAERGHAGAQRPQD